ncbi:MAG TPA: sulfate adenylyltransferase subunit CysD [Ideonella sp.]|uniref:sulfate adenylyltransferase subunit CysD n=1 Tax=Ideonella sp. TaxID=1929293 RepID=UPI002C94F225|nr:sulfate adenylyltransferase subunit CysD [Ideonella sp.]HSI50748.1 sulfate adenylyltransferase subunit CysD [Ideonella sp.]
MQQLNLRRRRAVQLRVDGRSLAQIRTETGLSVPTIIKACQAFTAGGWAAIDVGARGRPKGDGRVLSLQQEEALRTATLSLPPEKAGSPSLLWDANAVQALAEQRFGAQLQPRALARLLARWGLAMHPLRELAAQSQATRAWLAEQWEPALQATRSRQRHLAWAGTLDHPDRPAPGGLIVAISPRGTLSWLPVAKLASADAYLDFLGRLLRTTPGHWTVYLQGPDLSRAPSVAAWQAQLQARLALHTCPVAPQARSAAEVPPRAADAAPAASKSPPAAPAVVPKTAATFLAPRPHPAILPARPAAAAASSLFSQPTTDTTTMSLTHLQRLEAESIHIMREVAAEAENPVMLYSVGKDSAVMLHLARKAFFPAPPPFPLLHVDTTWKFRAMYELRDRMSAETGMDLLVYHNPEAMEMGINPFTHGSSIHTDMWKTQGLKQALDKYNFDVAFGGARRDEEKSRAKERIFSFRSAQHRWDPKNQRPELWRLYNGRKQKGESIRCFPISNWTELDVWQYIYMENIPIVPLYFAAKRPVVERDGTLIMVDDDRFPLREGEVPMMKSVRFRTLGCYPLSGAVESEAATLPDVIQEMLLTKTSERQGRMIDHDSAASMEKKKQEGYF